MNHSATFKPQFFALAFFSLIFNFLSVQDSAQAWDNHAQLTYGVLKGMPELKDRSVEALPLISFLNQEKAGLAKILALEEKWLQQNLKYYPVLPEKLKFKGTSTEHLLLAEFLKAIRINPASNQSLYLQIPAGKMHSGRPALDSSLISLVKASISNPPLEQLSIGEQILASEVLITASDEPDYGMDVNLFENNVGSFGKEYGFGVQPFGNDKLDYGTQAPFHMGFFHESFIIKAVAAFSQKSLVEYRIHLFKTLSQYAFKSGHPYWGFRFAGWALHYIQDLSVPYHSSMAPGFPLLKLILTNAFGSNQDKDGLINILSSKHAIFEKYVGQALIVGLNNPKVASIILKSTSNQSQDQTIGPFNDATVRYKLSYDAYYWAYDVDNLLKKSFPKEYVGNPNYIFGVTLPAFDTYEYVKNNHPEIQTEFDKNIAQMMVKVGAYSRSFLRSLDFAQ